MAKKMNSIEKLIAELCPEGVGFKELRELGEFYGGLSGKSKEDFSNGNAKLVTYKNIYSNIAINTDIDVFVKIGKNEKQNRIRYGDVMFTGSSETPGECGISSVLTTQTDEPLYLNSFCFGFRFHSNILIMPGFSKYLFRDEQMRKQIAKTASGVTRFNVSKKLFAKIKIPIPPLAIQQEIVKILDTFTTLEAELEAELKARKKQYEYYRDELLTFGNDVEWKTMGEVCEMKAGKSISASNISSLRNEDNDYPCVGGNGIRGYVNSFSHSGSFPIIGRQGALCGNVCFAEGDFYATEHAVVVKPGKQFISRFLYHLLLVMNLNQYATGGAQPGLAVSNLKKIKIPIPPLAEQERIVAILDKFDALVNDISVGLPAELNARRKQYEYYRNKLLTFEPLEEDHAKQ